LAFLGSSPVVKLELVVVEVMKSIAADCESFGGGLESQEENHRPLFC
jgi:hypothetical protein